MDKEYVVDFDEWVKPFGKVSQHLDEDFSSLLTELLHLIRGTNVTHSSDKTNIEDSKMKFVANMHAEWKKAEKLISSNVYVCLCDIEEIEKRKIKFHIDKDFENKKICIRKIKDKSVRIRILRRFYDAIVWSFVRGEHSTIRRFFTPSNIDNLSKKNIEDGSVFLEKANADRFNIAIDADITTFMHSGDALVFNPFKGTTLVEVKTGHKNSKICEDVRKYTSPENLSQVDEFVAGLNEKDRQQFGRIRKQLELSRSIVDVLNNGIGVDYSTGQNVVTPTTSITSDFFSTEIVSLYESLSEKKTWAIDVIDECLYLGVYSDQRSAILGFNGWMGVMECKSPVFNILDFLKDPLAPPLPYLDLPTPLLDDIMKDKVVVVMCLDVVGFIEKVNKKYGDYLFFLEKKESRKHLDSLNAMWSYEGRVVGYKNGTGTGVLGYGVVTRILYDFQRPLNMIAQLKDLDARSGSVGGA